MLQINKSFYTLIILISSCSLVKAMEIGNTLFSHHSLGKISLTHNDNGFMVNGNYVQRCDMDKDLRNISKTDLAKRLIAGSYLSVGKMDNDDYTLRLKSRLNGGGPLTGAAVYWVVKSLGYAVPAGIAVAGTVVAAPALVGAIGGGVMTGAVATHAGAVVAGNVIVASTGMSAGSVALGIGAGKVIAAGVGAELATTTTGGLIATMGAPAYIGAVESAATTLSIIATLCPWLP